jgi:RNA polymerase sigma-70 factor (ECF subfamily)
MTGQVAGDDALLVARMASGDERALAALYDRWETAVRAAAMRIVPDGAEADDVVEAVFWQAWRQAERFDGTRGGVGTWLLTIARSRALDARRALGRRREDGEVESLDETDAAAVQLASPDPLDATAFDERARAVRDAVRQLPVDQRTALELGYFEGLSQSEIAERTGEPLGTIKTRMRLALKKLRSALGPLHGDPT